MEPTNRLADVMAALDAERAKKTAKPRKVREKKPPAPVSVSFVLSNGAHASYFHVRVSADKPDLDPKDGWLMAKTAAGWIAGRIEH